MLAYFLNFALFYALSKYTNVMPPFLVILFFLLIIVFDIYAYLHLSILYYLLSQIVLTISILCFYYKFLPNLMKNRLFLLFFFIGIIYLGFINEVMNCKTMLKLYPNFPFHAIVEGFILIAVFLFCLIFYTI